jgi:protein phosphatase
MGGHAAGDIASRMVIDALARIPPSSSLGVMVSEVYRGLQDVNSRLCEEARQRRKQLIGSTAVVLLGLADHAVVIWAGDSRAYRYRHDKLEQLTRDHSRIEELVGRGLITREQAERHPAANIITRAVGVAEPLELDSRMFKVADGDAFLLCSDGLTKELTDGEIGRVLAIGDERKVCEQLVERALAQGGRDNISVVAVSAVDTATMTKTQWNPSVSGSPGGVNDDEPTRMR